MKKRISLLLLAALPLTATYAQNQKDSTVNRTVVVENEYNPHLSGASKINALPKVDEPAVEKKNVTYATDLRPVSAWTYDNMSPINREWTADPAKRGYLRAGYGTLNNVDVKAGYIADFSKKDRLQVNFSLDGWNGDMDNRYVNDWHSRLYRTDLGLDYSHEFSKVRLDMGGSFGSQVFNYMTTPDWTGTGKQHHTLGDFHVGVASTDKEASLQYRLQAGLKFFGIKYPLFALAEAGKDKETIVHTEAEAWKRLRDDQRIGVQVLMDNLFYSDHAAPQNYTAFSVNPYYSLENERLRLRIGARLDFHTIDAPEGKDVNNVHIAPDVKAEFLFSQSYILYLQAIGNQQLNDYRRLAMLSPYWHTGVACLPTNTSLDASLGLKASPTDGVWFHLFAGYRICEEDLSSGMNSDGGMYFTTFAQDKTKTAYLGAELKYEYKDIFHASLNGTYHNWKTDYNPEWAFLLSKPELELNFFAEAKVIDPLKVNIGYEFVKRPSAEVVGGVSPNLENINNLSVGANYTLLKDVSLFVRVNNLLNTEYYLTSGYPTQKLSVLAGVAVQF